MTLSRRHVMLIGAAVVAVAIAVWAVVALAGGNPGRGGAAFRTPPPAAGPSGSGPSAAPRASGRTPAAGASAAAPGRGAAAAEPFTVDFAQQPGVKPHKPLPSPTGELEVPANVDGCDHGYGSTGQCIPWSFPPGTDDKCAWLAERDYGTLAVRGADRHELDPDGNGVACDS